MWLAPWRIIIATYRLCKLRGHLSVTLFCIVSITAWLNLLLLLLMSFRWGVKFSSRAGFLFTLVSQWSLAKARYGVLLVFRSGWSLPTSRYGGLQSGTGDDVHIGEVLVSADVQVRGCSHPGPGSGFQTGCWRGCRTGRQPGRQTGCWTGCQRGCQRGPQQVANQVAKEVAKQVTKQVAEQDTKEVAEQVAKQVAKQDAEEVAKQVGESYPD